MITCSEDYIEYCREAARNLRDVEDLALRGRNTGEITHRVNANIVHEVELTPDDDLVDIGCGDGTLLHMAHELGVANALGLLATEEEAEVIRRRGLRVRQGLTHRLPIADESASVVVCNNVLLVVPREFILDSLREIERIAKAEARIFLGEIPYVPGPDPEPDFATARETLFYLYRKHGLRTTFGMLRRVLYWRLTGKPMIIRGGATFRSTRSQLSSLPWRKRRVWSWSATGPMTGRRDVATICFGRAELRRTANHVTSKT